MLERLLETAQQAAVAADARGPDGTSRLTARYLVGCVERLAQVTVPESVTVLENGDVEVAGVGRIPFGFTRTERGEFALGSTDLELMGLCTSAEEPVAYDDEPMTVAELGESIRRVLGVDLPLGEPVRMTRFTFHARQAERYRDGRIVLAGDAAHLFPARESRSPPTSRTASTSAGSWPPPSTTGRPPACWAPATPSAGSPQSARS